MTKEDFLEEDVLLALEMIEDNVLLLEESASNTDYEDYF